MDRATVDRAAVDWIAVDWGTSHMRAWPMAGDRPLARLASDRGMARLTPDGFEPALLAVLGDWLQPEPAGDSASGPPFSGPLSSGLLSSGPPPVGVRPIPVLVCGMAGARQGWHEAPYATVPCAVPMHGVSVPTRDNRLRVTILPGLSQARPADVMRGEETQIGGFLAGAPDFDGVLCLPGTHTKWVHVSAREIVSFRTFMTGELFALLSTQSVLRFSVGEGWEDAAFLSAVSDAMGRPAGVAADLFGLRAASLLHGLSTGEARARLSGLLIGAELAGARPYWLGQQVVVLGEDALAHAYQAALTAQGASVRVASVEDITLAGLSAAYRAAAGPR